MKFSININQRAVIENGFDIDLIDSAIIDTLWDFSKTSVCRTLHERGITYYWFSHKLICDQLPILRMKPDTIYRRMKKLCDEGFFEAHPENKKLNASWYLILPKCDLLLFQTIGRTSEPSDLNPNHRTDIRRPSDFHPMVPSDENPMYKLIKEDKINKDTITTEPENQKLAEARSDGESFNDLSRKDNQSKADVSDQSDDPQWLKDQKEKQKETMRPSTMLTWEEAESAIRKNEQCKRIAESTKKANQAFNWTFDGLLTAFLTYNKGTYGEVSNWKSEAAARKNFIQWLPKYLANNKAPIVEASHTSTRQSNLDLLNRLSQ